MSPMLYILLSIFVICLVVVVYAFLTSKENPYEP